MRKTTDLDSATDNKVKDSRTRKEPKKGDAMLDRSKLFKAYNAARAMANAGAIDRARLDKALGVSQRKQEQAYTTTPVSCSCPDHTYRGKTCKHILALMLSAVSR